MKRGEGVDAIQLRRRFPPVICGGLIEAILHRASDRPGRRPPPAGGGLARHCRVHSGNASVTMRRMIEIGEFVDAQGSSPFGRWVGRLDRHATARVATALYRMELGNLSNAKGVGGGVLEYRIDFGPGYRIYFGRDGDALIILLGGGTKARQQRDIEDAVALWREYRRSKRQED